MYHNREADVLLKQKLKEEDKWVKQYEKQQIDDELERQQRAHEEKVMRDALMKKTH